MELENKARLTPLTLASKLGRNDIFKEIIELQSIVSGTSEENKSGRMMIILIFIVIIIAYHASTAGPMVLCFDGFIYSEKTSRRNTSQKVHV